jgi:peptidoglycan/LPS O-acetylase OafA/YrhL
MARIVNLTFRSKASDSPGYRRDIEGLRAIAVISVIFFHAKIKGFPGGFVGVDIIERDLDCARFSFLSFYDRRIRRIFPALIAVVALCTLLGAFLFPPQQLKNYAWGLLAVTGFASNIYFTATTGGISYFSAAAGAQLLLHTWSLAVEEQFYLLFPVVLLLLHRFARKHRLPILLLLLILSFGLSVWGVRAFPVATFYLLPGRAWELLLGTLLALKPFPLLRGRWSRTLAAAIGLAAIIYAIVSLSEATAFPGIYALFPSVGAGLILYAGEGVQDRRSLADRILGCPPLVFLGLISYSLYLWHWPILLFAQYYYAGSFPSGNELVIPLLLTLLLAVLSFAFIESPFRTRSHAVDRNRSRTLWAGIGANGVVALVALGLIATNGLPRRYRPEKMNRLATNYDRRTDTVNIGNCVNYRELLPYSQINFCSVGHSRKNILVWGDSHALQLYPALHDLQQSNELHGEGLVFAIAGACPPTENLNQVYAGFQCNTFARYALMRAAKDDIDTVFLQFSPWWSMADGRLCAVEDGHCTRILTGQEATQRFFEEMPGHIRDLRKSGRRVILGLPFPIYNRSIPDLLIRNATLGRVLGYEGPAFDVLPPDFRNRLKTLAADNGAELFDPRETLCPKGVCVYEINGISLYVDESHIARSQVGIMKPGLLKALEPRP